MNKQDRRLGFNFVDGMRADECIIREAAKLAKENVHARAVVVNPRQHRTIFHQRPAEAYCPPGTIAGPKGPIKIIADTSCPSNVGWMFESDSDAEVAQVLGSDCTLMRDNSQPDFAAFWQQWADDVYESSGLSEIKRQVDAKWNDLEQRYEAANRRANELADRCGDIEAECNALRTRVGELVMKNERKLASRGQ